MTALNATLAEYGQRIADYSIYLLIVLALIIIVLEVYIIRQGRPEKKLKKKKQKGKVRLVS